MASHGDTKSNVNNENFEDKGGVNGEKQQTVETFEESKTRLKRGASETGLYEHIVEDERWSYLADPLILRGYNVNKSVGGVLRSLFSIHNESANVFIHLIGGFLFLYLFGYWIATMVTLDPTSFAVNKYGEHFRTTIRETFGDHADHFVQQCHDAVVNVATKVEIQAHLAEKLLGEKAHMAEEFLEAHAKQVEDLVDQLPPIWPLIVFNLGATICLLCSATFHLFVGLDKYTFDLLCRVDLGGISFMIMGSFFPPIVYAFHCDVRSAVIYLFILCSLCGLTLIFSMLPSDVLHRVVKWRVLSYIAAGGFCIIPLIDAARRWGIDSDEVKVFTSDGKLFLEGFLYIFGAFIFVSRIPERFAPGKFDYFFSSHQIWHVAVFTAAFIHYHGSVSGYHWRLENPHCGSQNLTIQANSV